MTPAASHITAEPFSLRTRVTQSHPGCRSCVGSTVSRTSRPLEAHRTMTKPQATDLNNQLMAGQAWRYQWEWMSLWKTLEVLLRLNYHPC